MQTGRALVRDSSQQAWHISISILLELTLLGGQLRTCYVKGEQAHADEPGLFTTSCTHARLLALVPGLLVRAAKQRDIKVSTVDLKTKEAMALFHGSYSDKTKFLFLCMLLIDYHN